MAAALSQRGLVAAISAYVFWGIAPIYFNWLADVSPYETVAHRVIWSAVLLTGLLLIKNRWPAVRTLMTQPRQLAWLMLTALLISGNWLMFIWAITHHHLLDASLGYFINPLLNVLLGWVFLKERLRRIQWAAVLIAALGVLIQIIAFGQLPWIALFLSCSFGSYGLIRKKVVVGATIGLWFETVFIAPLALIFLWWLNQQGEMSFIHGTWHTDLLLLLTGAITMIPLLLFAIGARELPLYVLGFCQYLAPSLMFLLAVLLYDEPLQLHNLMTFIFIWTSLCIISVSGLRKRQRRACPTAVRQPE